jgi:hypothetical protein
MYDVTHEKYIQLEQKKKINQKQQNTKIMITSMLERRNSFDLFLFSRLLLHEMNRDEENVGIHCPKFHL